MLNHDFPFLLGDTLINSSNECLNQVIRFSPSSLVITSLQGHVLPFRSGTLLDVWASYWKVCLWPSLLLEHCFSPPSCSGQKPYGFRNISFHSLLIFISICYFKTSFLSGYLNWLRHLWRSDRWAHSNHSAGCQIDDKGEQCMPLQLALPALPLSWQNCLLQLALLFDLSFVCTNYSFSQNGRCTCLNHLILSWRLRNLLVFYLNNMKFFGTTFHNVSPGLSYFI